MSLEDRFYEKVDQGNTDECWEWQATRTEVGYGRISVDGRLEVAHRVSWYLHEGEWPDGEFPDGERVLHTCDNRACVNPNHLYLGDQSDNVQDSYDRGQKEPMQGEQNPKSKLTVEDVREIRSRLSDGEYQTSIAEDFGISQFNVSQIELEKTWDYPEAKPDT